MGGWAAVRGLTSAGLPPQHQGAHPLPFHTHLGMTTKVAPATVKRMVSSEYSRTDTAGVCAATGVAAVAAVAVSIAEAEVGHSVSTSRLRVRGLQ